jgi:hypothetical protein
VSGYREDDSTKPTLLEVSAAKSLFGLGLAFVVLVAWAVGLIHL